jgi:hypothetical protein
MGLNDPNLIWPIEDIKGIIIILFETLIPLGTNQFSKWQK